MIWDSVKPFTCLCKKGYEGEICENGNNINMKAYICDKKAYIFSHITTKSPFIRNQVYPANQFLRLLESHFALLFES
jgi:hypothetical protein